MHNPFKSTVITFPVMTYNHMKQHRNTFLNIQSLNNKYKLWKKIKFC